MIHDIASIRRVLVSARHRILRENLSQGVVVLCYKKHWNADWTSSDGDYRWVGEVDHAIQQLADHGFDEMDSGELCRGLVTARYGANLPFAANTYTQLTFSPAEIVAGLDKFIALTPKSVATDPRVLEVLPKLSGLEQEFLTLLATAGDDERVPTDEIARHCWGEAVDDEVVRNVYRGIQNKLSANRLVQVVNARKAYKLVLKN